MLETVRRKIDNDFRGDLDPQLVFDAAPPELRDQIARAHEEAILVLDLADNDEGISPEIPEIKEMLALLYEAREYVLRGIVDNGEA